jgi:transposase InsO family protein
LPRICWPEISRQGEQARNWSRDITYISTVEGWLYLAVVLDLYSKRVIGWSMSDRIDEAQVETAIQIVLDHRPVSTELIVHSDRCSQYAAKGIQATLSGLKIRQSMSRTGNCWDNAVSESFFGSRKQEFSTRMLPTAMKPEQCCSSTLRFSTTGGACIPVSAT